MGSMNEVEEAEEEYFGRIVALMDAACKSCDRKLSCETTISELDHCAIITGVLEGKLKGGLKMENMSEAREAKTRCRFDYMRIELCGACSNKHECSLDYFSCSKLLEFYKSNLAQVEIDNLLAKVGALEPERSCYNCMHCDMCLFKDVFGSAIEGIKERTNMFDALFDENIFKQVALHCSEYKRVSKD